MEQEHFEIERKFLIRYPDLAILEKEAEATEIEQIYLLSPKGISERVRKRGRNGRYVYTHTIKKRISDLRRAEDEREITEEEYKALLKNADPKRRVIRKTRYCLPYRGMMFEIDVFPFWDDRAFMEIELEDECQQAELPPMISVIREVTEDRRYTNSSLAREIPEEKLPERNE